MIRFAEAFPDSQIVYALRRQLSWTHIRNIIYVENPLAREFYATMAGMERWSTRTLEERINSMLFERTAVSKKPEIVIEKELKSLQNGQLTPDLVFRDPYFLDFLGLHGEHSEKDLESSIVRELQRFILEMGIRVAQYMTELPPRELLERKLHDAILIAKQRLERAMIEKN
jgi:predicted nuclease of restriction endonuclease-like (RecB) superfamily